MEKSTGTSSSSSGATSSPERPGGRLDALQGGACPACGLPAGEGRFGWGGGAAQGHPERCPVCERVVDHFPAGCVELGGEFFAAHRQDILQRILRCGESEAVRYPAQRIKRMEAQGGRVEVWTSHARLAKRFGEFLEEQLGGQLAYHFERAPEVLRVAWRGETGSYAAKR